jgi:hypothetical protein
MEGQGAIVYEGKFFFTTAPTPGTGSKFIELNRSRLPPARRAYAPEGKPLPHNPIHLFFPDTRIKLFNHTFLSNLSIWPLPSLILI